MSKPSDPGLRFTAVPVGFGMFPSYGGRGCVAQRLTLRRNPTLFAGGTAPPKGTCNLPPQPPDTLSGDELQLTV